MFDNTVFQQVLAHNQARKDQMIDVASDVVIEYPMYLSKIFNEDLLNVTMYKMIDSLMVKQNEDTLLLILNNHFDLTCEQLIAHGVRMMSIGVDFVLDFFKALKKLNKV